MKTRKYEDNKRIKKTAKGGYPRNAYWSENGGYFKIVQKRSGFKGYMKKYNNKRIRRYKGVLSNGNHYRKANEHWCIIY